MDPLDIYLMILGATLLGSAYTVWLTTKPIAKGNPQVEAINGIKSLALYYVGVGVFALATGVWGIATWPLPSSYNIVLMDPWALFGAAALIVGLSLYFTGFIVNGICTSCFPWHNTHSVWC
jgi:putative membrane protein